MPKLTFLDVLKNNLKCAFCRNKNCLVRYYPERKKSQYVGGIKYVTRCELDRDIEKILKKRLP